jgi:hypothetical protein
MSFFAVGGFVGSVCQQACPVDGLRLAWASPLPRNAYTASLTVATARHHVSVPGAAYDLHCAYLGEPRRVRSKVSRGRPTPYACTSVRLPPPPACP